MSEKEAVTMRKGGSVGECGVIYCCTLLPRNFSCLCLLHMMAGNEYISFTLGLIGVSLYILRLVHPNPLRIGPQMVDGFVYIRLCKSGLISGCYTHESPSSKAYSCKLDTCGMRICLQYRRSCKHCQLLD